MLNSKFIGHVSPPTSIVVEPGQLRLFNKSIGEDRAIYLDESAARQAGHRSILAPPTFATCLERLAPQTGPTYEDLGIDYKYLLHGEESFEYYGSIYAHDTITIQTTITDMYDRKGGELEFMVFETRFFNQFDELVNKRRRVLVMRNRRRTISDEQL